VVARRLKGLPVEAIVRDFHTLHQGGAGRA
jgi:hypothetical protein